MLVLPIRFVNLKAADLVAVSNLCFVIGTILFILCSLILGHI
jgi:hypothetical protein